jgi:hypothetical protein
LSKTEYALVWALKREPAFADDSTIAGHGDGDCTNFVSRPSSSADSTDRLNISFTDVKAMFGDGDEEFCFWKLLDFYVHPESLPPFL